jgi:two-component system, sensor histidine kinase and response regulator
MSHEIRTPMNAIQGIVELLRRSDLPKKQLNMVDTIASSNKTLLHILNDILDLSKIEDGKLEIEAIDFNLAQLLEHLIKTISYKAEQKGLILDFSIDETIPQILHGDSERLRQILWNLISNAVKFTNQGSIELRVRSMDTGQEGVHIEFSVIDTGKGIAQEKLSTIFDPFTQVDSSRSRKHEGTGLGLAICKKLVNLMDGIIFVESELGKGSIFRVILMFGDIDGYTPNNKTTITNVSKYLSILLVEDEPVSQAIVEALLIDEGYQVTVVSSGKEALEKVAANPVNIILMDLRMPDMDGLEATRRIRANSDPRLAEMKIVAFTGDVMKETVLQCEEAGMDGVIAKPIDIQEVNRMLSNLAMDMAKENIGKDG